MKYAITITHCVQVGVDAWRDYNETRVFDETATISQINSWIRPKLQGRGDITDAIISTVEESQ